MQLNIVFDKTSLIKYLNKFLEEETLIFFYELKSREQRVLCHRMESKIIDMGRDTIIHIGDEAIFNAHIQNINGRLTKEDKVDFIYMHHEAYPNEEKITDTTFIWNTSNPVAKKNGDKLKKFIAKHFKKGMKVIDDNYISLNKSLANFYWPEEILHNKNKLFNTGGVVQITTLIS